MTLLKTFETRRPRLRMIQSYGVKANTLFDVALCLSVASRHQEIKTELTRYMEHPMVETLALSAQ